VPVERRAVRNGGTSLSFPMPAAAMYSSEVHFRSAVSDVRQQFFGFLAVQAERANPSDGVFRGGIALRDTLTWSRLRVLQRAPAPP